MIESYWKNKSVFITGHTGFKGSWLTKVLLTAGAKITGYALPPCTEPSLFKTFSLDRSITHIEGDIRDEKNLHNALLKSQPHTVFHLAAEPIVRNGFLYPTETFQTNLLGTVHLLNACRMDTVRAVVIVTTDKVYADEGAEKRFVESDRMGPGEVYGSTKACAELAAVAFRMSYFGGKRIATARAGNVIGGGDWSPQRLVPDIVRALLSNMTLELRHPNHVRPWQHVFDCVQGYIQLAEHLAGKDFKGPFSVNFGPNDTPVRVQEFANKFFSTWGAAAQIKIEAKDKFPETMLLQLDSQLAQKALNWHPQFTLTEAIDDTVRWYKCFTESPHLIESLSSSLISKYFYARPERRHAVA